MRLAAGKRGGASPQVEIIQSNPDEEIEPAIDLALVMQKLGDEPRAKLLLDQAAALIPSMARFGTSGYMLADVEIAALRGDKAGAFAALRRAVDEGWIFYYTEFPDRNPNLALLHGDPEYTALLQQVRDRIAAQAAKVRELELAGQVPSPPAA